MASRSYVAKEFATTNPNLFIKVKVHYAGKPELYNSERQGYWLSIVPYTVEVLDGIEYRTTRAYSGMKKFLEPATRYGEPYMRRIELDWEFVDEWAENLAARSDATIVTEGANA